MSAGARDRTVVEWTALCLLLATAVAFALIRVLCDDVVWHLATARLAVQLGRWPTTNAFSYTHPDYPLYQQYPVWQTLLYGAFRAGGWPALSVLNAAGWTAVLLLFMRWAGPLRRGARYHLAWMIALYALQRRMILRPDLVSMLLLGTGLLFVDRLLAGRRRAAVALPIIQLLWVNGHQLFPIWLALQALLCVHLALARRRAGAAPRSLAGPPLWLAALALAASCAAIFLSPLGFGVVRLFRHTAGSLLRHHGQVQEFAFVWDRPLELGLAVFCALPAAYGFWRGRRRLRLFDVGLWLATLALVIAAVRGLVFFGVTSVAVFERSLERLPEDERWPRAGAATAALLRALAAGATLVLAANVVYHRWVEPPMLLGGTQPGLGRAQGGWPDAAMAFLGRSPPPGRMMNLPWSLASTLWFHPEIPVFVDPRFESYPRAFLEESIASLDDQRALDRLIARYRVTSPIAPSPIFAARR